MSHVLCFWTWNLTLLVSILFLFACQLTDYLGSKVGRFSERPLSFSYLIVKLMLIDFYAQVTLAIIFIKVPPQDNDHMNCYSIKLFQKRNAINPPVIFVDFSSDEKNSVIFREYKRMKIKGRMK